MEKRISIYMVEDLKLDRMCCERHLNEIPDFHVIGSFGDAESCIKEMQIRAADIILMDLGLPNMNGIEATRIIKNKYPQSKIIVITSHQQNEDIEKSLEAGADGYIIKETNLDHLECVIKAVMYGGVTLITAKIAKAVLAKTCNSNDKFKLTCRELEVLELIKRGKNNSEISNELHCSISTVKVHVKSILFKLNVSNRTEAAVLATEEKLV